MQSVPGYKNIFKYHLMSYLTLQCDHIEITFKKMPKLSGYNNVL